MRSEKWQCLDHPNQSLATDSKELPPPQRNGGHRAWRSARMAQRIVRQKRTSTLDVGGEPVQ